MNKKLLSLFAISILSHQAFGQDNTSLKSYGLEVLITLLPVILFTLLMLWIIVKLKRDKVKLSDFLIDKEIQVEIKKERNPDGSGKSKQRRSKGEFITQQSK